MTEEKKEQPNIIQAIQRMIKAGNTEQEILVNLKSLGVSEATSKKLILLAEANTFSVLESDINSLIKQGMDKKLPEMDKLIKQLNEKNEKELNERVNSALEKKFEKQEAEVNKDVLKMKEFNERQKKDFETLVQRMQKIELDFEEAKIGGLGKRNWLLSALLMGLGIVFSVSSLYFFFTTFQGAPAIDSIIITVIIAVLGIIMFFISSLI